MTELDWVHATTDIPEAGRQYERVATAADCAAVSDALGIAGCETIRAEYRITPLPGGRYQADGTVTAVVTQPCVVTLEPVRQTMAEPIDVTFWPAADIPDAGSAEREILAEPDIEPFTDGRLDIGRVVFEVVASALDPYPRAHGAEFGWTDPKAENTGDTSPFAVLSKLKDKG